VSFHKFRLNPWIENGFILKCIYRHRISYLKDQRRIQFSNNFLFNINIIQEMVHCNKKVLINIICLVLDILLFISALISMIFGGLASFVYFIEMIYVCIFTITLFMIEIIPSPRFRQIVEVYCRFWMKLLGRGLTYIFLGCLTLREYNKSLINIYSLFVSIVSIVVGVCFSIAHFCIKYDFEVGDISHSYSSEPKV
jgi:hypothetical protein